MSGRVAACRDVPHVLGGLTLCATECPGVPQECLAYAVSYAVMSNQSTVRTPSGERCRTPKDREVVRRGGGPIVSGVRPFHRQERWRDAANGKGRTYRQHHRRAALRIPFA